MAKKSAGILLYRYTEKALEVLLVHPGGIYNAHRDAGAWSIPKGEPEEGEDLLERAKIEFLEETGSPVPAEVFMPLRPVQQKSGKWVYAWAAEGDLDVTTIVSNTIEIEYPYKSGKMIQVPEVDRGEWFTACIAREKINPAQVALIDELETMLESGH